MIATGTLATYLFAVGEDRNPEYKEITGVDLDVCTALLAALRAGKTGRYLCFERGTAPTVNDHA